MTNPKYFNLRNILIFYFSILQISITYWILFFEKDSYFFFYYCYHSIFFILLLLFLKKEKYFPAIIISGFIGQSLFLIDFIVSILLQAPFLNYYDFYLETTIISRIIVFFAHLISPLLALCYIKKYNATPLHFLLSCFYFALSYLIARLIVPLEYNIQGLYSTYTLLDNLPLYVDLFFIYIIIFYIIPNFLIYNLIHYLLNLREK